MPMSVDVVITAGDGRAAKKVFMKNKALLEVDGKSILRHIIEVLRASDMIGSIVVVGPKAQFEGAIGDMPVELIEQKRNLTENAWEGFLQTIPEYRRTGRLTQDIVHAYQDKYVLGIPGDIPLITVRELQEFISSCDMQRYDYCAGITSERILEQFGPRKGKPGIKMATFHARDGNFRQNNLHLLKPFKIQERIDLVLKVYEYRYQKELANIIRSVIEIVRLEPGYTGRTLWLYLLLQMSTALSSIGMEPLARLTRYPVTKAELERLMSGLLHLRVKLVETTIGGAALDVDNEKDFLILSLRYKDWMRMIDHHLA
ncbi:MAG TPA: NTP transferase domain-containing protein [Deltaproteobacteria bacterium]|nr:NTP transferase domain-containing protein [Deltaproteobacteria bacterium]